MGGDFKVDPRLGWMDGVKMALNSRGMMVEAVLQCAKDRKEWSALVHMYLNEFIIIIEISSTGPCGKSKLLINCFCNPTSTCAVEN